MRETDINKHFLAAVLQIFSNSANSARSFCRQLSDSISRFCLIFDANILTQNVQQVSDNNLTTSVDITDSV